MSPDAPVDLARLRRLRRNHYVVFSIVGLSAFLWIAGGLSTLLLPDRVAGITGIISMASFAILAMMIVFSFAFGRTRCPRCGKPFYTSEGAKGLFQMINYLTKRCVHCGQSMNIEPGPALNSGPGTPRGKLGV